MIHELLRCTHKSVQHFRLKHVHKNLFSNKNICKQQIRTLCDYDAVYDKTKEIFKCKAFEYFHIHIVYTIKISFLFSY